MPRDIQAIVLVSADLQNQSRDNCFILNMWEGKDKHENNLKYFSDFSVWGVEKHDIVILVEGVTVSYKIQVSLPMDLTTQRNSCKSL
jgi:hypothetical protein